MHFSKIPVGTVATVDARTTPQSVPDTHLLDTPTHLPSTDTQPTRVLLGLEGTAADTATVQQWALDDPTQAGFDKAPQAAADRKWHKVGTTKALTVGTILEEKAYPGKVYYQITVPPLAVATLLVAFAAGEPHA